MTGRLLADAGGQRTFVIVLDTDDDAVGEILAFARERGISAASLSAIGAFRSLALGYFDVQRRDYRRITIDEQVEVLSLIGNIAVAPEGVKMHAHVVVGKSDGTAHGGHLLEARVRPTLEVILVEVPAHLRRRMDRATGLALIDAGSAE